MPSGIEINNRSMKSISRLNIKLLAKGGLVLNTPAPTGFSINEGLEQKEQNGKNETGETVRLYSYPITRKPTATISFSHMQMELIAARLGKQLEERTVYTRYPIKLWVQKGEYTGAAQGRLGYGLQEDLFLGVVGQAPTGSVTRGELSMPLTQASFAQYNAWRSNPLMFAIGENGALRFSDDIVQIGDVVSLDVPISGPMTTLSDASVGPMAVSAVVIDSIDQVHFVEIYQATVDLANASVDFSADSMDLNLFLNNPPGACSAWNLFSPKQNNLVACAAG